MPMTKWSDPTFLKYFHSEAYTNPSTYQINLLRKLNGKMPIAPDELEMKMIHTPSIQYKFDEKACPGIKNGR